jgi:Lrp/AsnC family transcriptional regulator, leucine-responsive regulatory protein
LARKPTDLDDFDRAILRIVQVNAATPLREIAVQVNLSTAAVQRRIRRMEACGVIRSTVAIVDPTLAGKPITILVDVHVQREQLDAQTLKAHFSGPEIQQCYYVTGEADFVLVLNVATMEEYEALARRLFYDKPEIKWFRTVVVMDRVKAGLCVPF